MAGGSSPEGEVAVELPEIEVVEPDKAIEGKGDPDAPDVATDTDGTVTNPNTGSGSEGGGSGLGSANKGSGNGVGGTSGNVNTQGSAYNIPTLEEARSVLKSVAPNWRFIAIMPNISKAVGSSLSVSDGGAAYNSAKKLSSSNIPIAVCESVDNPPITIDTDQRFGGGTKINVARFITNANLSINFYEDEDFSVSKYIWAWHNSIVTAENLFYLPKDYKKDIMVWGFGNRSNTTPGVKINYIECFPSITAGGLNYSLSNNGFLVVNVDFTVDNVDYEF